MERSEIFGEESSSSDSSEESSSEEEGQGENQEQSSSSSESGGSDSAVGVDGEVKGQERQSPPTESVTQEGQPPSKQELFGKDSSSESSSESEAEGRPSGMKEGSTSSGSESPKPPFASPLGSPLEEAKGSERKDTQTVEGIFGDAADLSSSDDDAMPSAADVRRGDISRGRDEFGDMSDDMPSMMEQEGEGEREEEEEEAPRINVDIPRCVAQLGTDLHFVKLPNFLSVETRPFDPELYEDEGEDDDVLDEEGRARLKLKVENTIRWRYSQDEVGNEERESNARVVRWSDGTMSLMLGSEIFDISKQPLQGEFSHLFVRQGTGLQGQAVFRNKLTFRPHSTDSQTHRKMTLSIADRFSKAQKIRVLPAVGKDPESQRNERIKKEEENLRAAIRRESQKRRVRERHTQKGGLTASYLEPDREVDPEEDISAIKSSVRSRMGTGRDGRGYESEEESSEEEEEAHERLMKAKDGEESPSTDRRKQTRSKTNRGGGSARKVTKSRKLVFSSDEESD